ncbi:hypothetical protein OJ997_23005 [Solirubrobacter phytolaccae]|uniref:SMP-30/Gluconolactonase/LRE-like region domain-containing protein n=1 Tax=Solirubrobacter phytolaccae TaxID=1404360 RepID=A0A9X3SA26_9ACTN|nr:hypothetical protein [Solirubrobacter phytolaccae]MDA0183198.1 hypothetical protein [Solirubrobacter phytolaccae]
MRFLGVGAVVLCGLLTGAQPAVADYARVATVAPDDDIALTGAAVAVGSTPKGGRSALALHGLDGSIRPVSIPQPARFVEELQASTSALALLTQTSTGGSAGYYGPVGGPLRRLPRTWVDVDVTGDTVVSLHRRPEDRGRLELRDVRTGKVRRINVRGTRVAIVTAAGRYAAYATNFATGRETTVVVNLATGREHYRVRTPSRSTGYGVASNGRLWFVSHDRGVMTASRTRPRPRMVARMRAQPYEFAVGPGGIVVSRVGTDGAQAALVKQDGSVRALTPSLPGGVGALAYDGATLAFATGSCVFAGPLADAPPVALDGCVTG